MTTFQINIIFIGQKNDLYCHTSNMLKDLTRIDRSSYKILKHHQIINTHKELKNLMSMLFITVRFEDKIKNDSKSNII